MNLAARLFFLPGDLVCNAAGVTAADDRVMIRTLVDMLFWNTVIVAAALIIYL